MKFHPQACSLQTARVPDRPLFVAGVRVPRRALSVLADSSGLDGYFVLRVRAPTYSKNRPSAMFLLFDSVRPGCSPSQIADLTRSFAEFAQQANCVPMAFTLHYARRRRLYATQVLTIQVAAGEIPHPWDLMESLVLIYADSRAEAIKLFRRQL